MVKTYQSVYQCYSWLCCRILKNLICNLFKTSPHFLFPIFHKTENPQGLNRALYCFSFDLKFCYKRFTVATSSSFFHVVPLFYYYFFFMVRTGLEYSLKNCQVLENSLKMVFSFLNLKKQCLNFMKKVLKT